MLFDKVDGMNGVMESAMFSSFQSAFPPPFINPMRLMPLTMDMSCPLPRMQMACSTVGMAW